MRDRERGGRRRERGRERKRERERESERDLPTYCQLLHKAT